jgi:hypothetical protein
MCNVKIIGKIDLPVNNTVKTYVCGCCKRILVSKLFSNVAWGDYTCDSCREDDYEGERAFMRAQMHRGNISEDDTIIYGL